METGERIKAVEVRLDNHEKRLDAHGKELEDLRTQNTKQDSKLDQLCRESKENTAMTKKINGGVDTIKWLFGVALGGYTLYEILTKMGIL